MDSNVVKKPKTVMTDKQKAARCVNLAAGRKKRMEAIKQRKEKPDEYDISSNDGSIDEIDSSDSSDSSDNDAFVLTKAKKKIGQKSEAKIPMRKSIVSSKSDNLRGDVDELKSMMIELANMQKKQHKASKKRSSKKSGGSKIVVLPQHASAPVTTSQIRAYTDSSLDALRKSLGIY